MARQRIAPLIIGLLVVGCGLRPVTQAEAPSTSLPVNGVQETPPAEDSALVPGTPAAEVTPPEPGVTALKVWTIEALAPTTDAPGGDTLLTQLAEFDEMHPDIRVEVQVKRVSGRGSAIDYLRTAPPVAPSVLPDLVLLNRNTLVLAAREELIIPWDLVTDETLLQLEDQLYPIAVELARVDGEVVGLPYMLEIRHAVYHEAIFTDDPPAMFESLLADSQASPTYIFPASRTGGVNQSTLLQYMASGGRLRDDQGNLVIDEAALGEVLTFYEEALHVGALDSSVLQLSTTESVWESYQQGTATVAGVSTVPYLTGRADLRDTALAPVPTATGNPITLVSGWSWALVTGDPDRQALAATLVTWLMDPVNHGTYAEAAAHLPSQPEALAVWGDDDPYVPFANSLLEAAVLPLDPEIDGTVGVAMQTAVQDVLLGRASAQEAASEAAAAVAEAQGD